MNGMMTRRVWTDRVRSRIGLWSLLALSCGATSLWVAGLGVRAAGAYPTYSTNGTSGNCATCHGDFNAAVAYVSNSDGVPWTNPANSATVNLHDGHRTVMLTSSACNVCHVAAGRSPTYLGSSAGMAGYSAIGCLGCHGRAEPNAGGMVTGTGLRQHHTRNASATCGGAGCHSDADPATFTAAAESVLPPFYAPDAARPNKPTDPCNGNGTEGYVAGPLGLDNDGDNVYDAPDCVVTDVPPVANLRIRLEGAWPNPAIGGHLRVAFTLSAPGQAVLEAVDISGRRVSFQEVGALGIGRHVVDLAPAGTMSPGLYLLRLTQGEWALQRTVIVIR